MNPVQHVVDSHLRRVDNVGVIGGPQWRNRPCRIPFVTPFNLVEKAREVNIFPFFFQLLIAPLRPCLGTGREEYLDRRIGENHGSHVAPVRHQSRRLAESALARHQRGANCRQSRDS